MQKYKYFPYPQLNDLVKIAINSMRLHFLDSKEALLRQYSYDADKTAIDKDIDTVLLPLKLKGIRISDKYPIPKVGGGITTIGDTVVVLDRLGNVYACRPGGENVEKLPFPGLPNNITDYLQWSGAHLDVNTFKAYNITYLESAKLLAVSHEYFDKQYNKTRLAVSVIDIDVDSLRPVGKWKTIFMSDVEPQGPNILSGAKLATDGLDKIFLTVGDYEITNPAVAQDPNSTLGKIIEISVTTQKARILSMGHRNPQGLVLTKTGALLSTEHGPMGGDELELITEGSNYGWPNATLGTEYGVYSWNDDRAVGRLAGYQAPLFAWVPSIAVSNLIQVENFDPRWDGDLLIASLKAQSLFRLRLEEGRILYSEPIWFGQRLRDIAQLKNGTIVLWTDDTELHFISVDRDKLANNKRWPELVGDRGSIGDVLWQCMYCHHFGPTNASDSAPSLSNLFQRKIGSDNYRYSAALRNKEGVWTKGSLAAFLLNPDKFAPGTTMPPLALSQENVKNIVQTLKDIADIAK